MKPPVGTFVLLAAAAALVGSTACDGGQRRELALASESVLPIAVRTAPPVVSEAYRFAIATPGVLEWVPCYCGCGRVGHTSNQDCYVKESRPNGAVVLDNHGLG